MTEFLPSDPLSLYYKPALALNASLKSCSSYRLTVSFGCRTVHERAGDLNLETTAGPHKDISIPGVNWASLPVSAAWSWRDLCGTRRMRSAFHSHLLPVRRPSAAGAILPCRCGRSRKNLRASRTWKRAPWSRVSPGDVLLSWHWKNGRVSWTAAQSLFTSNFSGESDMLLCVIALTMWSPL